MYSVAQLCPTLCSPMNCSPSGSSVHGIFQARILEWVAISLSRGLPDPGIHATSRAAPALAGRFFTTGPPGRLLMVYTCTRMWAYAACIRDIYLNQWSFSPQSLASFWILPWSAAAAAKSLQSYPTLSDPRDGSPPGFPVPGILQARTLEWVAISFSTA